MPGHNQGPPPPPTPGPPKKKQKLRPASHPQDVNERGSDKHGGGANIKDKPPSFSKSERYRKATESWKK